MKAEAPVHIIIAPAEEAKAKTILYIMLQLKLIEIVFDMVGLTAAAETYLGNTRGLVNPQPTQERGTGCTATRGNATMGDRRQRDNTVVGKRSTTDE